MAGFNFDDDDTLEELADFEDYNVIQRPEEIIDLERKSSKQPNEKSSFESSKSSVNIKKESKPKAKTKEKKLINKLVKKGTSKSNLPYKLCLNEKSTSRKHVGNELDNKHECLLRSDFSKHKSVASKTKSEGSKTSANDMNHSGTKDMHLKTMNEPAITPQQRFQVLDIRDSAIRAKDAKQGDSKKLRVFGCCPDMCPEKERYSRIAKNCLSVFETKAIDPNSTSRDANHCFMVKEYSRSSADQQEPLPHELRPIEVLMFTMDYLICNIMDISLDTIPLGDWYDFIWNRTRSIRKDITQQQLCDIRCVDIIEKCVRFHIHCAESLSEEDTSTFDPKINNENLTKGLQTLKHMYHDLQSKGIQCPNEAEFRAYDILLSLTEGETLRLVKDIRKDLLKSPIIKAAFEAALSFNSSNYVKFFKIIEKANYLSSCILHRYIFKARADALQIIVRAYSTPSSSSMYPTSILVRDLKFENAVEACEFCRSYGLEGNESYITIDRRQFSKSASGLSLSRSFILVGSKRNETIGKVINNGKLPTNPLYWYQPHDSFDDKNMLKSDSLAPAFKKLEQIEIVDLTDETIMEDISTYNQAQFHELEFLPPVSSVSNKLQVLSKDEELDKLMKRRSYLLEKINKFESVSNEVKLAATKISEKRKAKHSHSKSKTMAKPHNSIMYFEDSSSLSEKPSIVNLPLNSQVVEDKTVSTTSDIPTDFHSSQFSFKTVTSIITTNTTTTAKSIYSNTFKSVNDAIVKNASEDIQRNTCGLVTSLSGFKPSVSNSEPVFRSISSVSSQNSENAGHSTFSNILKDLFTSQVPEQTKYLSQKSSFMIKSPEKFNQNINSIEKVIESDQRKTSELAAISKVSDLSAPVIEDNVALTTDDLDDIISIIDDSKEESNEIRDNNKYEQVKDYAEELLDELCTICVEEYSLSICREVLAEKRMKDLELEGEYETIIRNLMRKTIIKWKYFCERKRQRRLYGSSVFCSPWQAMLFNTEFLNTGVATPMTVYKKQCNLSAVATEKLKQLQETLPGWEEFKLEEIWNLSKCKPFPKSYFGNSGIMHFFKLCLVFPAECDKSDLFIFINWIYAKFSLPTNEDLKLNCSNTFVLNNGKTVINVVTVFLSSQFTSNFKEALQGISAMILCVPCLPTIEVECTFYKDLTAYLDSDTLMYPYPLLTIFLDSQRYSSSILSWLNEKLDAGYFTDIETIFLPNVKDFCRNSKEVHKSINWLIEKKSSYPLLQRSDFKYYLEDSFIFAFNILFLKNSLAEYKLLKQMPEHIISFYNKVFKFRSAILSSDILTRLNISWPPKDLKKLYPDFKFIDMSKQLKYEKKMKQALLPKFEGDPTCIESVWQYVEDISIFTCAYKHMLFVKIKNALSNSNSFPDWLTILNICAMYLIYSMNSGYLDPNDDLDVYYTKEDLETFESDEFWQDVSCEIRNIQFNNVKRKREPELYSSMKKHKNVKNEVVCSNVPFEEHKYFSSTFDIPDALCHQRNDLFTSLKIAVAEENKQSEEFIHQLNESIISGNVLNVNDVEKEHFSTVMNISTDEFTAPNANTSISKNSSSPNSSNLFNTGIDWIDNKILNKSLHENSLISLADKLSELKYNVQKSSILEEHFSQLLSKQF